MADFTGQVIGRYRVIGMIGQGGMAAVYRGYDDRLGRFVAIKLIRASLESSDVLLRRFEIEARVLAQLSHPNIVKVLDFGEYSGMPYLVMEYISGGTLSAWSGRPVPWQDAIRMVLPVAQALHYAHGKGVIHRDVKPSNILIGETGQPMLSDFGIAKLYAAEETSNLTGTGGIGTPDYMSPEQALGQAVDARADVYALGVVLYELVTGRKPFTGDTPQAVVFQRLTTAPARPSSLQPGLPAGVEAVILKAMARKIDDRYTDMGALAADLEALRDGRAPAARPSSSLLGARARRAALAGLGGLAGVALLAAGALFLRSLRPMPTPAPTAVSLAGGVQATAAQSGPTQAGPAPALSATTAAPVATILPSATVLPSATPLPSPTARPEFTATADSSGARVSPIDGMPMLAVPEGYFRYGMTDALLNVFMELCPKCRKDAFSDASPAREIFLSAFWIDRHEVTNAQFARFVADTGYVTSAERIGFSSVYNRSTDRFEDMHGLYWRKPGAGIPDLSGRDDFPVVHVSWVDADAYCRWAGRRLPGEAEWEKAARGADGGLFPWGNAAPDRSLLNYNLENNGPVSVESYPAGASPYGAFDMAGNVHEWLADYYSPTYLQDAPARNPGGPATGEGRVLRGGSWGSTPQELFLLVSTYRQWNIPEISSDVLGFRCAGK